MSYMLRLDLRICRLIEDVHCGGQDCRWLRVGRGITSWSVLCAVDVTLLEKRLMITGSSILISKLVLVALRSFI